jgi:acetolactate synthase-1/2/3 large subunit
MKMTGAQAIIRSLEMENVNTIFGYPGAAIIPFYDALIDSKIKHVLVRQEQGAAHAASGYARVTGKTGVCVATSGPGATNLITGIATAYMDSIPIVAITGQVSTELIGRDVFQEVDITGATAPFCKHNYLVKDVEKLPTIIKEAFYLASTGRPGPVLIDIPVDIQKKVFDFIPTDKVSMRGYKPTVKGHPMQIKRTAEAIAAAKKPVICAGGGVISAGASSELLYLAEKLSIPVTTTLMGIGAIPSGHPLCYGMVGTHGSPAANYAVNHADLLIILGARVGDRAMGRVSNDPDNMTIVHIDIDPAEIGKNVDVNIPVVGDVKQVLTELIDNTADSQLSEEWKKELDSKRSPSPLQEDNELHAFYNKEDYVNPGYVISILHEYLGDNRAVTTEVGQNQIWTAVNLNINQPHELMTSGGLGTMGYGLPAAIGAKIGCPDKNVVTISGDGSFQMSMQELGTIKHYDLGIKIILFNNSALGMVREMQKNQYRGRYSQVHLDKNPDFIKIAEAYGIKGKKISSNSQVRSALAEMMEDDRAFLLECVVSPEETTLLRL